MKKTPFLKLILCVGLPLFFIIFITVIITIICCRRKSQKDQYDVESADQKGELETEDTETEELIVFNGGEDLTICDILDAPGEVIGKSSYGTLYKASLQRSEKIRVLRFLRPVCTAKVKDFNGVVEFLGSIRHENLVPVLGFYAGPRGEKLMVHPFFGFGNISEFIRDSDSESNKWTNIYKITIGIARALHHLHTELQKPVVHGNLKSKNVLLDRNFRPFVSDYGLHLLLNPTAGQEILEASAAEGYKAPELIKLKDVSEETDIYSLGVIMLELISGKEPINQNPTAEDEFYLPDFMRNAVLDHRISDLYRPEVFLTGKKEIPVSEESVLKFFQLAMTCCSPSPSLRPKIKQILRKLEEIG